MEALGQRLKSLSLLGSRKQQEKQAAEQLLNKPAREAMRDAPSLSLEASSGRGGDLGSNVFKNDIDIAKSAHVSKTTQPEKVQQKKEQKVPTGFANDWEVQSQAATHITTASTHTHTHQPAPSRHQRSSSGATRVTGVAESVVSYGGSTYVQGGQEDTRSQAATTIVPQQQTPTPEDTSRAVSDYQFFLQYTYTPECALLAFNFTEALMSLGVFEHFDQMPDRRVVAVQVTYLFYKYQMHHNDMALDLALCLTYLEEAGQRQRLQLFEKADGFNVLMYSVFLAHVWNNDRTVCLSDWYKEVGWQTFAKCAQLNAYVLNLMQRLRNYRLRASNERVRDWVLRLCTAPKLM